MMNNEKEKDTIDTSKLDEILPKYDPLKLNSINLAQNYVSAFNTGMNIYQCVNQLQGYIEWVVKAVNDVVKLWNVQVGESIDQSKAIVRETTTEQFNVEWTNKQPELIEQVNTLTTNQFKNVYVTPEMFGAVGDGVTDDTEAIKTCISNATDSGKMILLTKMYGISEPISFNSNRVVGTEYKSSGFKALENVESVILINTEFNSIENITIDGNGYTTNCISVNKAYINIDKCLIKGATNSCIVLSSSYCNTITRNRLYGGEYGIICNLNKLENQASQNATSIIDNTILLCEKYAFVIGGGDSWRIERNVVEQCKLGVGIFTGINNLIISNNYFEGDAKYSKKYMQDLDIFYIRALITLNMNGDIFSTGKLTHSVVIENNFVNICDMADDNIIPGGYNDISTFVLSNNVKCLNISNNRDTSENSKYLLCFGSRSANVTFDRCNVSLNDGFNGIKMLGRIYDSLTVNPTINSDETLKHNYLNEYDFSNVTGLTLTEDGKFYDHKAYSCTQNDTYGYIDIPKSEIESLLGKTVTIGFFAKIPEGAKVKFYDTRNIFYVTNQVYGNWTFIGTSYNMPETIETNFRFYFLFDNLGNTPVRVSRFVLNEIGYRPIDTI